MECLTLWRGRYPLIFSALKVEQIVSMQHTLYVPTNTSFHTQIQRVNTQRVCFPTQ